MSTKTERQLERAALNCHRRGLSWGDFWQEHGPAVCRAEPRNRQRFALLVRRLLALLMSGDTAGQQAIAAAEMDHPAERTVAGTPRTRK